MGGGYFEYKRLNFLINFVTFLKAKALKYYKNRDFYHWLREKAFSGFNSLARPTASYSR